MWQEMWLSSGDDEIVNGCHSFLLIEGTFKYRYWPALYLNTWSVDSNLTIITSPAKQTESTPTEQQNSRTAKQEPR